MNKSNNQIKIIILLNLFLLGTPVDSYAGKHALLVGITEFPYDDPLPYSDDDVYLIKDILIDGYGWPENNITVLIDEAADYSDVLSALDDLDSAESNGDTVLIMFSTHGKNLYGLFCNNAFISPPVGYYVMSPSTLNTKINELETDNIMVILDISEAGYFDGKISKGVILMASSATETSYQDDEVLLYSVFSYFVAKGMSGFANLSDPSISAVEVFDYAAPLTTDYVDEMWDDNQTPVIDGEENDFDMFVKLPQELSGTLSYTQYWSGSPIEMEGNVTVPSGVDLTIVTDSYLDFNGYTLTVASGGGINLLFDGAEINYGTLTMASGSSLDLNGNTLTIASGGTLDLGGDLAVTPGTLVFASNSNLDLNNHYLRMIGTGSIIDYGMTSVPDIVVKQGSTKKGYYSDVQTAINNAISGQKVWIGVGPYDGFYMNLDVDVGGVYNQTEIDGNVLFYNDHYSTLSNMIVAGNINIMSSTGNTVMNVTCEGVINVYTDCSVTFSSVHTGSGGYYDFEIYSADININYLVSEGQKAYGVKAYGNTSLDFYLLYAMTDKTNKAIFLNSTSEAYFATGAYFCENEYDVYADDNSSAEFGAGISVYLSGIPPLVFYGDVYGDAYYYLCGFYRRMDQPTPDAPFVAVPVISDPGQAAYRTAYSQLQAIHRKQLAALEDEDETTDADPRHYEEDYLAAVAAFQEVVTRYPGSPSALKALARLTRAWIAIGRGAEVEPYVSALAEAPGFQEVKYHVLDNLIFYYLIQGETDQALRIADEIIANSTDDYLVAQTIYYKGVIYRYHLDDIDNAVAMYQAVVAEYPDHSTAQLAQAKLEELGADVPEGSPAEPEVTELSLAGYPNPFNPTATIRFGLPEGGNVTLVVYDLMGREVVRLVEGHRDAGWQELVWDGRDARGRAVPTGIYIARLATPQETRAIKLVMMK